MQDIQQDECALTMEISRNSSVPIYKQIQNHIIQQVKRAELKPGASIPSENELARRYGISRMTARKAIENLAREGVVNRVPSKGTFVTGFKRLWELSRLRSFTEEVNRLGALPGARTLQQEITEPTQQIAGILKLATGEKVVRIERVRTMDRRPTSLTTSYFPARLCAGLAGRDLTDQSIYRLLEGHFGLPLRWARETIGCCNAPKPVARLLEIKPGTAVITTDRELFLADETPIEYMNGYTRTDFYSFTFELRR